jgi:elongation factor G
MLKSNAVAITLPIEENDFKGIVDLVKMKLLYGMMIRKGRLDVVAIPEEMLDEVKEYRSFLLKRLLIMMKIC